MPQTSRQKMEQLGEKTGQTVAALLQRWLLLIAVGPVVIMIMLRAFVEDPILTPYPPAEHVARKHPHRQQPQHHLGNSQRSVTRLSRVEKACPESCAQLTNHATKL